jgi:hypothetical protein
MSELTTADLAGGTTQRNRMAEPAIQTSDPRMDTGDPAMHEPMSQSNTIDSEFDARPSGVDHADMDARETVARPIPTAGTSSMASSGSRLTNPAASDGDAQPQDAALFPAGESEGFRSRWTEVQTGFVDEPRHAVEQADGLVAEMMQTLATVFAEERAGLEEQWSRGDNISTEDLRQALRRYRSFFNRLLSV